MKEAQDIVGWAPLKDRAVLSVTGTDARPFLQDLVTNDLNLVSSTQAVFAALLTPQGKFLFDFFIFEWNGNLHLDCEAACLDGLVKKLTRYRLRADVTIKQMTGMHVTAILGANSQTEYGFGDTPGAACAIDDQFAMLDPRDAKMGIRLISSRPFSDTAPTDTIPEIDRDQYDQLRYRLGIADSSRELASGQSYIMDFGFERLNGIDFEKGCYVGQEVTARMKYRNLVKRALVPIEFDGVAPAPGTPVHVDDAAIGEVRSATGSAGLALIKIEALQSGPTDVRAGALKITLHPRDHG